MNRDTYLILMGILAGMAIGVGFGGHLERSIHQKQALARGYAIITVEGNDFQWKEKSHE